MPGTKEIYTLELNEYMLYTVIHVLAVRNKLQIARSMLECDVTQHGSCSILIGQAFSIRHCMSLAGTNQAQIVASNCLWAHAIEAHVVVT